MKAAGDDSQSQIDYDIELPSFLNPTPFLKKTISSLGFYTNLISPRSKSTLSNTFNAANLLEENYKTQTNLGGKQ
jgi:hypothetical protein